MGNDTATTITRTKAIVNAASAVRSSTLVTMSKHSRCETYLFVYLVMKPDFATCGALQRVSTLLYSLKFPNVSFV